MTKFEMQKIEKPTETIPARMPDEQAKKIINEKINFENLEAELKVLGKYRYTPVDEVIDSLEVMARLVLELKSKIYEYDTILSDDASGRLLSLLIRKLAKAERMVRDISGEPKTFFLAAGGALDESQGEMLKGFLGKKLRRLGKVLLVTEHISTGGSIGKLIKILEDLGIDFDIAALSLHMSASAYPQRITKRLYFGDDHNYAGVHLFYQQLFGEKMPISGVSKEGSQGPHPVKIKSMTGTAYKARKDIDLLAKEFEKLL